MPHYAVTYAYGAREEDLATRRAEHRDYLARLAELVISGPWDGGRGALLVFRADTAEQVEAVVAADPFVEAGFVERHEVREWNPVLGPLLEHLPG